MLLVVRLDQYILADALGQGLGDGLRQTLA